MVIVMGQEKEVIQIGWMCVSKAKILVASSSDKSGLSNGQTTKAVIPSSSFASSAMKDNNKNTVRFTSLTEQLL